MGMEEYYPLVEKYKIPIVVTGFEPVDLVQGILMVVEQLEKGEYRLENQYSRVVHPNGNPEARKVVEQVFITSDREWRGGCATGPGAASARSPTAAGRFGPKWQLMMPTLSFKFLSKKRKRTKTASPGRCSRG